VPHTTVEVQNLQDLVKEALAIKSNLAKERFLWYRGIHCVNLMLVPKIMRDGKTADEVFEREGRLITRFRQRSIPLWPTGYQQSDWEHLFAMQHYGLPTRLLDWSENLFVGAHFALEGTPSEHAWHDGPCTPGIWIVDPVGWNRSAPVLMEFGEQIHVLTTVDDDIEPYRPGTTRKRNTTPVAIFGTHNTDRIVSQRGTFMVWGKSRRP
jgi:hypothetical protein